MSDRLKPVDAMDQAEAAAELKRLAREIAEHDRRYYADDAPNMTHLDAETSGSSSASRISCLRTLRRYESGRRYLQNSARLSMLSRCCRSTMHSAMTMCRSSLSV